MPPKSKRRIHLEKARASKRTKEGESETEGDTSAAEPSISTIQEPSEDPTLEEGKVEANEEYDEMSAIHIHATEWVESLSRDDLSIAIFRDSYRILVFGGETQHLGGSGGMFPQENAK